MDYEKTERARQHLLLGVADMLGISVKKLLEAPDPQIIAWVFKTAKDMAQLENRIVRNQTPNSP